MSSVAYPIVLTPVDSGYVVTVPDFDINTQGNDIADALYMARDAISLVAMDMEDDKKPIPAPSALSSIHHEPDEIVLAVDVDVDSYRRRMENRAVKKTLTIPSWLDALATDAGVNFSQVLQDGLKHKLHVHER